MSQITLPAPGNPVPAAPQQSLVPWQRSPSMWQPLARWQTFTPVGPYGAQSRLQQLLQPSHTVPSTPPLQYDGPVGAAPHAPTVAPSGTTQKPPQHWVDEAQASPAY